MLKNKKIRKKYLFLPIFFLFATGSVFTVFSLTKTNNHYPLSNVISQNANHFALASSSQSNSDQTSATYEVKDMQMPLNKNAYQVTPTDIKNVVTPKTPVYDYSIVIIQPTLQNYNLGYVNFLIIEKLLKKDGTYNIDFATNSQMSANDNINSSLLSSFQFNTTSGTKTPQNNNVFATSDFTNLANWITPNKFNVVWKDSQTIEQYIKNFSGSELTPLDVWNNLLNNVSLPHFNQATATQPTNTTSSFNPQTSITVAKVSTLNKQDVSSLGLYQVTLTFSGTTADNWADNTNTTTVVRFFGGFDVNNVVTLPRIVAKQISGLAVDTNNAYRFNQEIEKTNTNQNGTTTPFFNSVNRVDNNVSANVLPLNSLLPSRFIKPFGKDSNILDLLINGSMLTDNSNSTTSSNGPTQTPQTTPTSNQKGILGLDYGNLNLNLSYTEPNGVTSSSMQPASTSPTTATTQQEQPTVTDTNTFFTNVASNNVVQKIDFVPNDQTGSLEVIVYYKGWNVYSGTLDNLSLTFNFGNDTFSKIANENDDFFVNFKSNDALNNMRSSFDIINTYYRNQDNPDFLRLFTNEFINASNNVLNLNREVAISYADNSGSFANGLYNSSTEDHSLNITLTFPTLDNGKPFSISNVYTFENYRYQSADSLLITWESNKEFLEKNPTFKTMLPTQIAFNLATNVDLNSTTNSNNTQNNPSESAINLPYSVTNTARNRYFVTYEPNNNNGSLTVYVRSATVVTKNNVPQSILDNFLYQQTYTGFRQSSTNAVEQYSFIPQFQVDQRLLDIPIQQVTKEDVLRFYLNNFLNAQISPNDITITPVFSGQPHLNVKVIIRDFNQENTNVKPSTQTFFTNIYGFNSYSGNGQDNSFQVTRDNTLSISISIAAFTTVVLGVTLASLILKRSTIRRIQKAKKEKKMAKKKAK